MISAGGMLPPVVLEIIASIDKLKTGIDKAQGEVNRLDGIGASGAKKFSAAFALGFAAIGTSIGLALKNAIAQSQEAELAMARFRTATESLGQNLADVEPKVKALGEQMVSLGFDDEEATLAFTRLNMGVRDANKSLGLMPLAADLARVKHMSLTDAAVMLARATTGNARVFTQFGIAMDKNIKDPAKRVADAFERLNEAISGQAAAYADTFAGKLDTFKERADNLAQKVGDVLLPPLTRFLDLLIKGVQFLTDYGNQVLWVAGTIGGMFAAYKTALIVVGAYKTLMGMVAVQQALAAASGVALTTAQGLATVATMGLTGAMNALKAAFLTNPIGLIAMAFVALVAAIVYAWNNFEWFRKGIAMVAQFVMEKMALLGDKILGFFKTIVDFAFGYGSKFMDVMENLFGWIPGLGDKIAVAKSSLQKVWTTVGTSLDSWGDDLRANARKIGQSAYDNIMEGFGEQPGKKDDLLTTKIPEIIGTSTGAKGKGKDAVADAIKEFVAQLGKYKSEFSLYKEQVEGNLPLMLKLASAAKQQAADFMKAAKAIEAKTRGTKNHTAAMKALAQATDLAAQAQAYQNDVNKKAAEAAEATSRAIDGLTNTYARNNSYLASINRLSGSEQVSSYIEVPVIIDGQVLFRVNQKASLLNNRRNSTNGLARSGSVI